MHSLSRTFFLCAEIPFFSNQGNMSTPPAPTRMGTSSTGLYDYDLLLPPPSSQPPPPPHLSPILITILVFSVITIACTFLYLLFRHHSISPSPDQSTPVQHSNPSHRSSASVTPLPLFTFSSVVRNSSYDSDCAICLSKFHPLDKLRLLPLCCHAFHAVCIDTWLHTNKTCPLCRSSIHASDSNIATALQSNSVASGGSFRLEIGSVHRQTGPESGNAPTAYSIGSYQYIVDGESEVIVPGHHRSVSVKDESGPLSEVVDPSVVRDMSGERNWLGDYVDRLSATLSYSRRFFTGSSRRSEVSAVGEWPELDESRVGEEISEWFRWASGV